jgi:Na+-transporting NADH:ubiquinone oxidoreductase subunit NqrB
MQESTASIPAAPPEATLIEAAPRKRSFDTRYIAPLFITCILLVAQLSYGVLESYPRTLLAIATSIIVEAILSRTFTGKWPHLASAYISGISVGILIRSPEYWPYALCAAIAITSKYVIRFRGRHLWNPSNFAISFMLFFAAEAVAPLNVQWDNRPWAMVVIWIVGSIIIWNLRRFHICATYIVSFLVFALLRAAILNHWGQGMDSTTAWHQWLTELAPITGPVYQLFIFFMITDPKTTVKSKRGQCVVAFAVAAVEMILRLNQNVHAPYYALFIVGPIANFIELWWTSRRKSELAGASPAAQT